MTFAPTNLVSRKSKSCKSCRIGPNVRAAFPLDAQYTPPAFLTAPIVFAFSCNDCNTQEKLRAILVHNFRVKQGV